MAKCAKVVDDQVIVTLSCANGRDLIMGNAPSLVQTHCSIVNHCPAEQISCLNEQLFDYT